MGPSYELLLRTPVHTNEIPKAKNTWAHRTDPPDSKGLEQGTIGKPLDTWVFEGLWSMHSQ